MTTYLVSRIMQIPAVIILVTMVVFGLLAAVPGDPLDLIIAGNPDIRPEDIARIRAIYGLDDPLPLRYGKWLTQLAQGNAGYSRAYKMPVLPLITPRMKNTLTLAAISSLFAVFTAIPIGLFAALNQHNWKDHALTFWAVFGYSAPNFWLGLVFIVIFSVWLGWLPAGGLRSVGQDLPLASQIVDRGRYLIMPAFVMAVPYLATWVRYMRSQTLEVIGEDYIRTARAKGLPERIVIYKHLLRNTLIPVVTMIGLSVPQFVGGAVIVETVFSYPGMGRLMYDSILGNDYSVAMVILLILSLIVLLANLVTDISYAVLDPRIRYS